MIQNNSTIRLDQLINRAIGLRKKIVKEKIFHKCQLN